MTDVRKDDQGAHRTRRSSGARRWLAKNTSANDDNEDLTIAARRFTRVL
jgi:hypothetical protein